MRVLLVTSWGNSCGIAEYAQLLKEGVESVPQGDGIEIIPSAEALDPGYVFGNWTRWRDYDRRPIDLVHLNHHDALHSRWDAELVKRLVSGENVGQACAPVLLTYHDTREKLEDCPKLKAMHEVCSSTVVHEPVEGLKAIYWRQGVPRSEGVWQLGEARFNHGGKASRECFKSHFQQPVLGSVGFNFPWKNFERLAEETGKAGWGLLLIAHDATLEHEAYWRALNPYSWIIREFLPQSEVVCRLAACDATAFMYECANTGTSAAIRQGIAARKPVIAFSTCRQFRDLLQLDYNGDPDRGLIKSGIRWCEHWDDFPQALQLVRPGPWDPGITALAHADSWQQLGRNYAQLYRTLVGVDGSTL